LVEFRAEADRPTPGVTGIAGYNSAQALLAAGWRVVGLARTPRYEIPGVEHVYADVLDQRSVEEATDGKGILFRAAAGGGWRQMWPQTAAGLGVAAELVDKHDLIPYRATDLASWWHTDARVIPPLN
jgi:hypothetical protein